MRKIHVSGTELLRQLASIGKGHTAGAVKRLLAACALATAGMATTAPAAHAVLDNVNVNVSPAVCDVQLVDANVQVGGIGIGNTNEQENRQETECSTENEQANGG